MSPALDTVNYTDRTMYLAKGILAQQSQARDFQPEDALVDVGLSSLDLVNLMIAVEAEFDIMIPPAQLNPKNFYSVGSIARMIETVSARA
ncbi:acyl carrier protein [Methylobacterium sp. Leaf102]|uniref:phosphopantetheine-binding protein n=1 Tax=Methylobacterium sp. Leaf102 TaxID=1736253 RepID=UPI0006FAA165|nr:phosphopantetheine-binding protein [Methylobacterium sp. Leaf102]KQP34637.1 acyl carrier protein [Methylobacterium sp. Leaf102]